MSIHRSPLDGDVSADVAVLVLDAESGILEQQAGVPLDPAHADVFLCGNPEMIQAAKRHLEARGFVADADGGTYLLTRRP